MFFKNRKRRKHKFINGAKGAISILLCLLMTPCVSIALGLVEYHRYQSVIEIADEILELLGFSSLACYDSYIHDRFGLLAVDQQTDINDTTEEYAQTAAQSFGKQIKLENVSIKGELTLMETEVLKQQVVDFSELTVPAKILMDDLKIEELINSLNVLDKFQAVMGTVSQVAEMTKKLTTAVDSGKKLITALNTLQTYINNTVTYANNLASSLTDLCDKLNTDGLYLPSNATEDQWNAIIDTFTTNYENYKEDLLKVIENARNLKNALSNLKTQATVAYNAADKFAKDVKAAAETKKPEGSSAATEKAAEESEDALSGVLDALEAAAEEAVDKLKEDVVNTINDTVDTIVEEGLKSLGIYDLVNRYGQIASGDYFKVPLSDMAKEDLKTILSLIPAAWNGDTGVLLQQFKNMLVPQITFKANDLIEIVQEALDEALESLKDSALTEVVELLNKLVNALKALFDLDVFYEADMNAFVDIATSNGDNPYQTFLNGVGSMFDAVDKFGKSVGNWDLLGMLTAAGNLLGAVWDTMNAILSVIGSRFKNMATMISEVFKGDFTSLYERLLIAGYMRHNLPSRVCAGDNNISYDKESDTISSTVGLGGDGLTGFSYNDIARPDKVIGQVAKNGKGDTAFQRLAKTLDNIRKGSGDDTMFVGAELEYICAGTNSEITNQVIVFFDLYFLRLLLNVPTIFMDAEVASMAAAATIASWLVYLIYMLAEPFMDVLLLVNGGEVDIVKTKCFLTAGGLTEFTEALLNLVSENEQLRAEIENSVKGKLESVTKDKLKDGKEGTTDKGNKVDVGVGYETLVMLLLVLYVDDDVMINRLGDIIELETTEYYDGNFKMKNTYATISISADVSFDSFFDLGIANGGGPLDLSGKMVRDMGY